LSLPNAIPIFPLDGVILVPGARLPLHIFEPRYRDMVNDALEGPGLIAMGMPMAGHTIQSEHQPPIHVVCGLGRIGHHRRNDDGTIDLVLEGIARLRILSEVQSGKSYREVQAEPLHETYYGRLDEAEAARQLLDRLRGLSDQERSAIAQLPFARLLDVLLLRLPCTPQEKQTIFSIPEVDLRFGQVVSLLDRLEGRRQRLQFRPGDPRNN
jgi:Lon protease-like protein